MLAIATPISAQQEFRVVEVVVDGNRIATEALILGVASLEIGQPLTPTTISETIRRLYGLGIFSDVRIDAEDVTGGLKVYIVVKELPKLSELKFIGNKKIKDKELKEQLGLGVGGYISPYLIEKKKQELKKLYAEKGFFQAEITPQLTYSDDSTEAKLSFTFNEKSKVKVEKVVINGAKRVKTKDLIKKMRNRKRGFLKSSDFAQEEFSDDLLKVINEYHERGYIDAYMISDSMYIDTNSNKMTIFLNVYEGPRYYFGDATFSGNEELPTEVLKKALKYKKGHTFNSKKYDESIMEISSAYYEIGHLHVRIADQRTTRADSIIDISYTISEGLPSHVQMINIIGNTKTKEHVIRREISTLPGQKFSRALLIRSVRDVMALNYFANVEPIPRDRVDGDVDIDFKITEKQTGQISAGAGYNSQDKMVGTLGMGIPNFRGNGQNLNFSLDFGSRRNSFSLSFTEPWLAGRPTLLGINMFALNRRWFNDYTEGRTGGSIRLGRRLKWPDNYFRVFASYSLERNRFFDFDDSYIENNSYKSQYYWNDYTTASRTDSLIARTVYSPYPGSVLSYNEETLTASRLTISIVRDSRNLPQFATSGSKIAYNFQMTGSWLGGFWQYQKHELTIAKFFPLFWKLSFAAKVQYNVITRPKGDDRVLISDRFTPGGTAFDGIVRGYNDGTLTPDSLVTQSDTTFFYNDPHAVVGVDIPDDTSFSSYNTRVRGMYMLVGNFELQFPITEGSIYALAFFDAGNSWLYRGDINLANDLYRSAGVGFRVVVPAIGTIGFDFAYPFDVLEGQDKGWKPHFQIGTTFR